MRVAIRVSADAEPWGKMVTYVQEAERLGAAVCFVPEAWHDAGITTLRLYPAGPPSLSVLLPLAVRWNWSRKSTTSNTANACGRQNSIAFAIVS
jgi:hypothetical protein